MSLYQLPEGLPVPEDDGATDHLLGQMLPQLTLESSRGSVSVRALSMNRLVLYIYPRTGHPDTPAGPEWDAIPGARGCTPQSCAFRDHTAELEELGAAVAGAHTEVFGAEPERDVTRWFSDASVLTRYGIEALNYGTSSGLPSAELGENLDIDGLVQTAEVYARAAMRICGT